MMIIPFNLRGIILISLLLGAFGIHLILRGTAAKEEFQSASGSIVYLSNKLGDLPKRHKGKYRYLIIDSYEYPFQIFIGQEAMDFSPKYQNIDEMLQGDQITVYFDESNDLNRVGLNKRVQFIEKADHLYFERGSKDKYGGIGFLCVSPMFILWALYMKRKGKIAF